MTHKHQPDYDKILSPIPEINACIESLLDGSFGALMGDQREGLKRIYSTSWGLHTLLMDIITSIGIENIAKRSYLSAKFDESVNPIIEHSKALKDGMDGPLSEEQAVCVDYIFETGLLLRRYIDNLALYSRILHKQMPVNKQNFALAQAIDALTLHFHSDDVALDYQLPDDLPLVHGDEQATHIALQHLLQNALDATQRGYVRLSATVQDARIQIEIEDSGTGIAVQHRDSIFEPFYQGDKAKSGLGLGLNIARGLIEQQQGELHLRQTSHEGTIFVCTLPMNPKLKTTS
jgi:two-component system, LuxR family, secretion system sensor histidine kinase SsrA